MKRTILLFTIVLVSISGNRQVPADDDIGLPDELFLQYGRQLTVGEPITNAVKDLVENRFNCDDVLDRPQQILKCEFPLSGARLVVKMTAENGKLTDFETSVEY